MTALASGWFAWRSEVLPDEDDFVGALVDPKRRPGSGVHIVDGTAGPVALQVRPVGACGGDGARADPRARSAAAFQGEVHRQVHTAGVGRPRPGQRTEAAAPGRRR